MTATSLRDLIGPAHAAEWTNSRVHDLVTQDLLDPNVALTLVEGAVRDNDPLLLASPGQLWQRRPLAAPYEDLPPSVMVVRRLDEARVVVDDGTGEEETVPVWDLILYQLRDWFWGEQ
ncbi:hypothetical protein ACIRO1_45290 [Streptomyces sp. NPDC102381]|uniref:hypothetical protein n=1 Tax=Streptomyces sp. NPDC102381 TaxID=3366164 RepID=UPI0038047C02